MSEGNVGKEMRIRESRRVGIGRKARLKEFNIKQDEDKFEDIRLVIHNQDVK